MNAPETRYARNGDVSIAYQVVGDGPIDIVYVPGFASNLLCNWQLPSYAKFLTMLGSFSRLIVVDRRGTDSRTASRRPISRPLRSSLRTWRSSSTTWGPTRRRSSGEDGGHSC